MCSLTLQENGRGVDDHYIINVVTNLNPKYSSQVNGVSFSADGSLVASCSGKPYTDSGDFSVRMWSVETGQELKKFLGHRCVAHLFLHPRGVAAAREHLAVRATDICTSASSVA
jgi:WD40 repeat protein